MRRPPHRRDRCLLLCVGGILAVLTFCSSLLSRGIGVDWLPESWQLGFAYEVDNRDMPTVAWLLLLSLGSVLVGSFVFFKKRWDVPAAGRTIFGFAIILRLLSAWGEPIHESDFYRYLWDGKSAASGVNPYRFEPGALLIAEGSAPVSAREPDPANGVPWKIRAFSDSEKADLRSLEILRSADPVGYARVSHPNVPSVYPPLAQTLFFLVATIFGGSLIGLKGVLIVLDLGVVLLILSLLAHFRLPKILAILYAWHPLVLKEFANSAHYDVLPILCGLLAFWGAVRFQNVVGKAIWIGIWIGLGVLAKYYVVLLLPILVCYLAENRGTLFQRIRVAAISRAVWLSIGVTVGTVLLGFWPFSAWGDVGWARLFEGLAIYGEFWQYNPGVFGVIERGLHTLGDGDSFSHARGIGLALLALTVLWISLRPLHGRSDGAVRCFQVLAALFVLSQTAFPWYLCWALAFLPFRPRWSWAWLSVAWPWNYLDFQPDSIASVEWNGFYLLSSSIWLSFFLVWIAERALGKIPLRPGRKSEML